MAAGRVDDLPVHFCPFIARLNQPETTQRSSPVRPRGDWSGAGKVAEPRGVSVRVSAPVPPFRHIAARSVQFPRGDSNLGS